MITLFTAKINSPIGSISVLASDDKIYFLQFTDTEGLNADIEKLIYSLPADLIEEENNVIETLKIQLSEYFNNQRIEFDIPLQFIGTDFQKKVWHELINIKFGTTKSYKLQAAAVDNIKSVRAVAHTNAINRILILVPCHRVIGENGNLTGYAGGLWRKQWLLEHENRAQGKLF